MGRNNQKLKRWRTSFPLVKIRMKLLVDNTYGLLKVRENQGKISVNSVWTLCLFGCNLLFGSGDLGCGKKNPSSHPMNCGVL
jgi:hypothetical protein